MYTRETFEKFTAFEEIDPKLHEMIPQRGVKHIIFPPEIMHNAIWDYVIHPNGRHFLSLCAEISYPDFVHFYEYIPRSGELRHLWNLNDVIVTYERAIRPSKVHTSMSFLPDGRIIMTTHTTASAPNHPYWMPAAYYSHLWEGYPGSNIIIFDPETGKVEDLGIPVPRESIYGGIYDKKTNAYYFGGYIRGHIYRLDLSTRHVTDYGQAAEFASFRFVKGLDGHIYNSSKSGRLYRINTDTKELEDLSIEFPLSPKVPLTKCHNQMVHAVDGPDGKLYMLVAYNDKLLAYNYRTNLIEVIGDFMPDEFKPYNWFPLMHSMAFDDFGTLWYGLRTLQADRESATWLVGWDFLNGKKPENFGIAGTPGRSATLFCEMYIKDDILYGADTNHALDPPAMFEVDLTTLREDKDKPRLMCQDPYYYTTYKDGMDIYGEELLQDADIYYKMLEQGERDVDFISKNPDTFRSSKQSVTKLWKHIPPEQSRVNKVWFDDHSNVHAICGKDVFTHFVIKNGEILSRKDDVGFEPQDRDTLAKEYAHLELPAYPGRNYMAVANVVATLRDCRKLIGTKDGMLAIVDEDRVFSLGPCAPTGPIHEIVLTSDKSKAYGVAGDKSDLGMIFSYDDANGLKMHGRIHFSDPESVGGSGSSCEPYCIAISPDDKKLAVGVIDRLGCVYEFNLDWEG